MKYFVSYAYTEWKSQGFGNYQIERDRPITSNEDIQEITKTIRYNISGTQALGDVKVTVLNWRRFEQDE